MVNCIPMAIAGLHHAYLLAHNARVGKTVPTGFSSLESHWRTTAALVRLFCVRMPLRVLYGWAMAGVPSGTPGSFVSGLLTPPFACPPRLAAGSGFTAHKGGHDMAALPIPARSAHTYPLTEIEARRAVRIWFTGKPSLSLADWRDNRCLAHCAGLPDPYERGLVFREAFARELSNVVAGGLHAA